MAVKNGDKSAYILAGGRVAEVPGIIVQAVVTTGAGPDRGGRGGPLTRGQLCTPPGKLSTTILQSVISMPSSRTSRFQRAVHVREMSMRLAVSHGSASGVRPSIRRSSITKRILLL